MKKKKQSNVEVELTKDDIKLKENVKEKDIFICFPEPITSEQLVIYEDEIISSDNIELPESPPLLHPGYFFLVLKEGKS